jgi:hypothetical protein
MSATNSLPVTLGREVPLESPDEIGLSPLSGNSRGQISPWIERSEFDR